MESPAEMPAAEEAAAHRRKEEGFACPNPKCMCKECTCGAGCTCNVSAEVTCDPCSEFRKKMQATKSGKAEVETPPK